MTENEFQALMISRLDRLENQLNGRADRLENGQAELHGELRDLDGKVDRILESVQGQAGARIGTDERIAALERRVAELEKVG